jgi:DNA-binding response OmpR family regulator
MRILIFGLGSPGSRKPLERTLQRLGHEVFSENDGDAAISRIGEMEIPVVIADGRLPKFDWIELCRRLRANPPASYVHFILLSPQADDSHEIWALDAGVDDFIDKLNDETELRRRLRPVVARQPSRLREAGAVWVE